MNCALPLRRARRRTAPTSSLSQRRPARSSALERRRRARSRLDAIVHEVSPGASRASRRIAAECGRQRRASSCVEQRGHAGRRAGATNSVAQDFLAGLEQPALVDQRRGARRCSPLAASAARWRSIAAASSATPSPRGADGRACTGAAATPVAAAGSARPIASMFLRSAIVRFGVGPVALADDVDVGDLEDAGLDRLDVVAEAGRRDDHRGVRRARDVDLVLAHADGLDHHDVEAGGVEHVDRFERAARKPAQRAARRHAAHEHAGVAAELAHADAVAEDRAAGERARRIDGDDRHLAARARGSPRPACATSVDLPLPGTPVMPTTCARPGVARRSRRAPAALRRRPPSARVSSRAMARVSPASTPATSSRGRHVRHRRRRPSAASRWFISRNTSRSSITRRALKSVRGKVPGAHHFDLRAQARASSAALRAPRRAAPRRRRIAARARAAAASTRTSSSSIAPSREMTIRCSPP